MPLLGPDGNPISSEQTFKKAAAPKTGEAFGPWAGRDLQYFQLPGGAAIAFDTSKLTLSDFRQMRDHYQINASLSVLMFMLHQLEWTIECDNKKIADVCREQLTNVWTQLVRAKSQAFWAGYSPNILQWENDIDGRQLVLAKVKDLLPEEARVHWKGEKSTDVPGVSAARPYYASTKPLVYDGIKRSGLADPIPVENCVAPDTLILCADLQWRRAGDLEVGTEIVAFDEDEQPKGRRYRTAVIEVNNATQKDCVRVTSDIGDEIVMSVDHPCLVRRGSMLTGDKTTSKYTDHWIWVKASELQPGDRVGFFGTPWEEAEDWEAGYIAGIFDGEGSLVHNGSTWNLQFSQRPGWVLDRALDILDAHEFKYRVSPNSRDDCMNIIIAGGIREIMRFIGVFRPERIGRNISLYENVIARIGRSVDVAVIQTVESVGLHDIASIQTSTGTFITQGYLTHNTYWYPLLMENGNYYGKKLLKPAFQSWFFSILMHLFSNRYFERFGEPIPVGRVPMEEMIKVDDNTEISANRYMLGIIEQLRNRSAVVLPSDRIEIGNSGRSEYEYALEYLESQMRGADFERYLTRLDEEISLSLFTPLLMLRTADVGSYNLGVTHAQVYLWMLNAIAGDWQNYINKYILSPIADFNFSTSAPRPKLKFRKLGQANAQTLQAIMTSLTNNGSIKYDMEELGQAIGLQLEEVEQLVDPDPASDDGNPDSGPGSDPRQRNRSRRSAGPRGVGQPRATTKDIAARLESQVSKAFRSGSFGKDFTPDMGYQRRFEESLMAEGWDHELAYVTTREFYTSFRGWLEEVAALGTDEFSTPEAFMSLVRRALDARVDQLADA